MNDFSIGDLVTWVDGECRSHRGVVYGIKSDMTPRSDNEGRRLLHIRGDDGLGYADVPADRCAVVPREED